MRKKWYIQFFCSLYLKCVFMGLCRSENWLYKISRFRCDVVEDFALPGCYVERICIGLLTFQDNLSVPNMGPICRPKTCATIYELAPPNIAPGWRKVVTFLYFSLCCSSSSPPAPLLFFLILLLLRPILLLFFLVSFFSLSRVFIKPFPLRPSPCTPFFPFYSFSSFSFVESTFFYSCCCPSLVAAWDLSYMLNKRLQPPDDTWQSDQILCTVHLWEFENAWPDT